MFALVVSELGVVLCDDMAGYQAGIMLAQGLGLGELYQFIFAALVVGVISGIVACVVAWRSDCTATWCLFCVCSIVVGVGLEAMRFEVNCHGFVEYLYSVADHPEGPLLFASPAILALLSAVIRFATRRRRRWAGQCRKCGYLLMGLVEPRCPECGTGFDLASIDTGPGERVGGVQAFGSGIGEELSR